MKSKPDIATIKKIPVNAKISKLDEKEFNRSPSQKISDTPKNFDDDEPGKEFQAGEKEGDFPPDIQMSPNGQPPDDYVEDTDHRDSSKSHQH